MFNDKISSSPAFLIKFAWNLIPQQSTIMLQQVDLLFHNKNEFVHDPGGWNKNVTVNHVTWLLLILQARSEVLCFHTLYVYIDLVVIAAATTSI